MLQEVEFECDRFTEEILFRGKWQPNEITANPTYSVAQCQRSQSPRSEVFLFHVAFPSLLSPLSSVCYGAVSEIIERRKLERLVVGQSKSTQLLAFTVLHSFHLLHFKWSMKTHNNSGGAKTFPIKTRQLSCANYRPQLIFLVVAVLQCQVALSFLRISFCWQLRVIKDNIVKMSRVGHCLTPLLRVGGGKRSRRMRLLIYDLPLTGILML